VKALLVIYNSAIESMVIECMKECGLESYTKFPRIHGAGKSAGPRFDTHVWPGLNNALFIVAPEENIPEMLDKIRALKERHLKEGVKAFVLPVEDSV